VNLKRTGVPIQIAEPFQPFFSVRGPDPIQIQQIVRLSVHGRRARWRLALVRDFGPWLSEIVVVFQSRSAASGKDAFEWFCGSQRPWLRLQSPASRHPHSRFIQSRTSL
jgi:hypothetical protein